MNLIKILVISVVIGLLFASCGEEPRRKLAAKKSWSADLTIQDCSKRIKLSYAHEDASIRSYSFFFSEDPNQEKLLLTSVKAPDEVGAETSICIDSAIVPDSGSGCFYASASNEVGESDLSEAICLE